MSKAPTGIGVVSRNLADSLDPKIVLLLDPLGGLCPRSIPIPGNLMPEFGRMGHFRRLFWTQREIPKLMKKHNADFLISPLPEAPLFCGVRSIVLAHDLIPLRFPRFGPLLAYQMLYVPLVLHSAVRVLCNSKATANEIHSRLAIPIKKIIPIPLGYDKEKFYPMNLKRDPFFLVLGRHDPHKNIPRVLRALSLIPDSEVQVWFVGPHDQRFTPKLIKMSEELRVSSRCRWIPWVSDQERLKLINRCKAVLIPSLWEGFGLPALEAMACDTAVIASNRGALPEVVSDDGLLIDPEKPADIADAMTSILKSQNMNNLLIQNGRKRLKLYSWDRAARIIEDLIRGL